MNWRKLSSGHERVSVIVNDLDFMGVAILPGKTDPPLVIDTNTVLAASPALELLQSIPWWHAQVFKGISRV